MEATRGGVEIGNDLAQNTKTQYTEIAPSNAQTEVYLTVDDSGLIVSLPTSVILSGVPDAQGKYIGKYSIKATGNMSGDKIISVAPDNTNVPLTQKGKTDKSATITQTKTEFSSDDLKNSVQTSGIIAADKLTAGSWNSSFDFDIEIERNLTIPELIKEVLGKNAALNGSLAASNTSIQRDFTDARLYDIYAIPFHKLGLKKNDVLTITNNDDSNYMISADVSTPNFEKTEIASGWTTNGKTTSIAVPDENYLLSFTIQKLKSGSNTSVENRTNFDLDDVPIQSFKFACNGEKINYIEALQQMYRQHRKIERTLSVNLHNADADVIKNLDQELKRHKYSLIDVDLRSTKDGVWVNSHLDTLNNKKIAESTYEELKVGDTYNSVKTFQEMLEYAIKTHTVLQLEDKTYGTKTAADKLWEIIHQYNAEEYVCFSSGAYKYLKDNILKANPNSKLMLYDIWNQYSMKDEVLNLSNKNNVILNTSYGLNDYLDANSVKDLAQKGFKIEFGFNHISNQSLKGYYQVMQKYYSVKDSIYSFKVDYNAFEWLIASIMNKNKFISLCLAAVMTASAVPTSVFAASIGSSSANTSMGMDTTQNATTQYTEVAPSNAQTKVCLTIDDSDLVVSLPTSVVLSGTPDAQGKYIGKYSVGVSGDMSSSKSVKIKPEGTARLTQSGAQNKTASITQQKTTFTTEDFKNKAKTEGTVSADSLTAGSWTGDFNFNVGY